MGAVVGEMEPGNQRHPKLTSHGRPASAVPSIRQPSFPSFPFVPIEWPRAQARGNHRAISRAADSSESEAWMRLYVARSSTSAKARPSEL